MSTADQAKYIYFDGKKFANSDKTGYYLSTQLPRVLLHRYIYQLHYGEIPLGYCIHHVDGDINNNNIHNLIALTNDAHRSYHGEIAKISWRNKASKECICKYCGKTVRYVANNEKVFCSKACNSAYRRKLGLDNEQRKCAFCGKLFITNKYHQAKVCSDSCARSLYYQTKRDADRWEVSCKK